MADPLLFQGLSSLAQGFLAGQEMKRQREADEKDRAFRQQQFEFQQQEALRQAERQDRADKAAFMGLAQRYAENGQEAAANRIQRQYFPELNPDIVTQKPVEQILPASTMPALPVPTRLPMLPQIDGEHVMQFNRQPIAGSDQISTESAPRQNAIPISTPNVRATIAEQTNKQAIKNIDQLSDLFERINTSPKISLDHKDEALRTLVGKMLTAGEFLPNPTLEQKQALKAIAVLNDQLNNLGNSVMSDDLRQKLYGRLLEAKNTAFGQLTAPNQNSTSQFNAEVQDLPTQLRGTSVQQTFRPAQASSQVQNIATAPRGSLAFGPQTFRSAGAVDERTPAPDLFKAQQEKIKPEHDPLVGSFKQGDRAFTSGWMDRNEYEKFKRIEGEYYRTGDKNAAIAALQGIKYRERPQSPTSNLKEIAEQYNALNNFQTFVGRTEQAIDRAEDNYRAKEKDLQELQAQLTTLEKKKTSVWLTKDGNFVSPATKDFYTKEKTRLDGELRKAETDLGRLSTTINKLQQQKAKTAENINTLEQKIGFGGNYDTGEAEETIKVDY